MSTVSMSHVDSCDESAPAVLIELLGEPRWRRPGHAAVALTPKDAALLAKLALDGPQARPVLCNLLWPEVSADKAADSLRQRVSRLNRAAEFKFVELGSNVRLHARVWVDAVAPAALGHEALMHTGALLAGLDFGDNAELDRWLQRARLQVAELSAQTLADQAETLERAGRLHEALLPAQRVVELLPMAEHGWRRLMRLHYLRNDRAAAQDAFWRLTSLLRDELGIRPSAETLQLMQTVEAADPIKSSAQRPVPASVLRPPVLIGRARAWQAMSAAWQRSEPFLLIGDAGLGKSRLLEDFGRSHERVVSDRAQPGDEHSPYSLLGRILLQIEQRFSSPALPSGARTELARLRPEFGPAPRVPANTAVLRHAIQQFLAAAIDRGLQAIVLDDLHDADTATIEALRWLGASPALAGLRLGLATRPKPSEGSDAPLMAWLEDSRRPTRVYLEPLTREELSELLISLALPSLLDDEVAAQMFRHAGGHPLYTLATLQDALARGADLHAPQLPRPSSVQSLLDARLRGLPPAAQDLLRVAAVAGADLRADRAARLLNCSLLALADTWALLEAANVLRGEAFSHDLVQESALRAVPQGVRQALHREMAALLAEDSAASPARVAWHWEQGEHWAQAGRHWHAAGEAARRAGRLAEQAELFERAARCHQSAGDEASRFEALHARLDSLQMRHGGSAALAALPDVQALADTGLRRLRCRLARADALLDLEHAAQAAAEAEAAVHEAAQHPALLAEAGALHARALVQCRQFEPALEAAAQAIAAAQAVDNPLQKLRALDAMSYVHYATGSLAEAVTWQRQAVAFAEAMGHRTEAITGEGHVAALLASIGDVPATYAQALHTRARHRDIGLGDNSTLGTVNHIVLGNAAAALGRFDEALEALQTAVSMAGPTAAAAAQAKSRLALASLWLTLGRAAEARALMDELPSALGPGMQMQAELVRAQAAEAEGSPSRRHLIALERLAAEHANLPLVVSVHFESSYVGAATAVIERLRPVQRECEALGLHGTARALQWRALARWLEIPGPAATEAALEQAKALHAHAAAGLSAKCYPPQTWLTLSRAYARGGEWEQQARCESAARCWLSEALPRVPAEHRTAFVQRNRVNRIWMSGTAETSSSESQTRAGIRG